MKKAILVASILAVGLTPGLSFGQAKGQPKAAAGAPEAIVYDAASAMAFLTTLNGEWQAGTGATHEHGGSPAARPSGSSLSFKTKAAGSAVVQTTRAGQPGEMETIFHMDGDQLLLTHYCALQNAPVLKFEKSNKPGELKFVFQGGTNFDPAVDAHFHQGTFQIKDKDTLEQNFTVFANGKANPEGRSVLHRVASN
jgi:hypothetical protein